MLLGISPIQPGVLMPEYAECVPDRLEVVDSEEQLAWYNRALEILATERP